MPQRRIRPGATTVLAITTVAAGILATATAPAVAAPESESGADGRGHGHGHRATQRALDAEVRSGVPGATAQAVVGGRTWTGTAGRRGVHDHYRAGSLTKTFVATVLLQLEAEGKLDLDDTVDRWLPGLVSGNGNDGTRISLRRLLNHTSGVFNYTDDTDFQRTFFLKDGFLKHRYDTWTPARLVRVALRHKPDFAPGTKWSYSNTNYILAGLVVERVTGRSYADEIRDRVIGPLHLTGTSLPGTDPTVPLPASRAYSKLTEDGSGKPLDVTELNPSAAGAAGELVSDSKDLNTFYSALLGGELLPKRQLKEMKTTVPTGPGAPTAHYGLALIREDLPCGKTVWGHSGGIHGSATLALTTSDGGHSLAFNFNGDWSGDPAKVALAEFCEK
ncbi:MULTISPECIES: serine hydrolase [unclassified Streptomyces]|uniref:serine hydrolase domain-containing protein n=1 Tax=unclassified Streptomyces TaxID=2593676 RepID=UPI00278C3C73|nr:MULTISPECIES: serine hydrolase domain-containing protein [unclassified Streptomyces]